MGRAGGGDVPGIDLEPEPEPSALARALDGQPQRRRKHRKNRHAHGRKLPRRRHPPDRRNGGRVSDFKCGLLAVDDGIASSGGGWFPNRRHAPRLFFFALDATKYFLPVATTRKTADGAPSVRR